jgi:ribosome-binding protein aMBF1 (putative translation factor)
MPKTKDALKIIDRMVGDDTELRQMIAEEKVNATIAQMIYDARTEAGLTQKELADRVGTKQPVIARLEDAEYEGHSLSMLNRIAEALDRRLLLELTQQTPTSPARRRAGHAQVNGNGGSRSRGRTVTRKIPPRDA